jgi:hypothetical protein
MTCFLTHRPTGLVRNGGRSVSRDWDSRGQKKGESKQSALLVASPLPTSAHVQDPLCAARPVPATLRLSTEFSSKLGMRIQEIDRALRKQSEE